MRVGFNKPDNQNYIVECVLDSCESLMDYVKLLDTPHKVIELPKDALRDEWYHDYMIKHNNDYKDAYDTYKKTLESVIRELKPICQENAYYEVARKEEITVNYYKDNLDFLKADEQLEELEIRLKNSESVFKKLDQYTRHKDYASRIIGEIGNIRRKYINVLRSKFFNPEYKHHLRQLALLQEHVFHIFKDKTEFSFKTLRYRNKAEVKISCLVNEYENIINYSQKASNEINCWKEYDEFKQQIKKSKANIASAAVIPQLVYNDRLKDCSELVLRKYKGAINLAQNYYANVFTLINQVALKYGNHSNSIFDLREKTDSYYLQMQGVRKEIFNDINSKYIEIYTAKLSLYLTCLEKINLSVKFFFELFNFQPVCINSPLYSSIEKNNKSLEEKLKFYFLTIPSLKQYELNKIFTEDIQEIQNTAHENIKSLRIKFAGDIVEALKNSLLTLDGITTVQAALEYLFSTFLFFTVIPLFFCVYVAWKTGDFWMPLRPKHLKLKSIIVNSLSFFEAEQEEEKFIPKEFVAVI